MSELFKEIEDDLRQENLDKLWQKIGKALVYASAAIVLLTVGYEILKNHRENVAMERTDIFLGAVEKAKKGDEKGAIAALGPLTQDANSSYYGVAMLKKASLQTASGDAAGASETYKKLAEKNDVYGKLGALYSDPGKTPVASVDMASPFYHPLEERRGWQLLEEGKKDEAAKIFSSLYRDNSSPAALRARMQEVLQSIAPSTVLDSGKPNE